MVGPSPACESMDQKDLASPTPFEHAQIFFFAPNIFLRPKYFSSSPQIEQSPVVTCLDARVASLVDPTLVGAVGPRGRRRCERRLPAAERARRCELTCWRMCSRLQLRAGYSPRRDARKGFPEIIGGCSGAASGS